MKLAIDAFPLIVRSGGVQRYAYEMIRRLPLLLKGELYLQGLGRPIEQCRLEGSNLVEIKANLDRLIAASINSKSINLRDWLRPLQSTFVADVWFDRRLRHARQEVEKLGADLFWGTSYFIPSFKRTRTIVTVHDLVHLDHSQWVNPVVMRQLRRHFDRCVNRADRVMAASEFTKSRLIDRCGIMAEKISVTYNGVGPDFRIIEDNMLLSDVRSKYYLPEHYLLFVSTLEPRKNVVGLMNAYVASEVWKDGVELVLVGARGWKSEEIFLVLRQLQKHYPIRWLENVPHQDLPVIYNLAKGFVFPSYYEGFGIPIIEAMACGCAVLTSSGTGCEEVSGALSLLVDPTDSKGLRVAISCLYDDWSMNRKSKSKILQNAKCFSWEKSAQVLVSAMYEIL